MPQTTVAVLGTGILGLPVAANLAADGFTVRAWNRTRSRAEPLTARGVLVTDTPADAVSGADVIITLLSDGSAVTETITAVADALSSDAVWIQSSTVGVHATEHHARLADELGVAFVDAPVLGSQQPAENGELVVLAAGAPEIRDRVQPIFDTIGHRTRWVGDSGAGAAGSRLKLVANSWVLAIVGATGEAIALAQGLDVDPHDFLDAVSGGGVDSPYLQGKGRAVIAENYEPSFSAANAEKDARLVAEAAILAGVQLDVAEAVGARLRRAVSQGHGADDVVAAYFASWPGGHRPDSTS
ncbi:NAD(P)-dependent oxidoreductase [Umezawaea beigongshangensis]|uniref:NAD(P)-dependent oxidoreductase n=1 Tax=Umezawaea beigongshangensis TaxID=2780383 RepID=UPI0018F25694|nr:NAD(P)-dependent oxidoreductase [Umezawaea beigongshangensis]